MSNLYVRWDDDGLQTATPAEIVAALRANDEVRAEVLDGLGHREEVEQRVVASWKARAEAAEARILEYKASEGHMREELRAAGEREEELTAHRNALQSDLEAEQAGRMVLRHRYGARENETFGGFLERVLSRVDGPIQTSPFPQVAEASARRWCTKCPHLLSQHEGGFCKCCECGGEKPAPSTSTEGAKAGTPLTVEMVCRAARKVGAFGYHTTGPAAMERLADELEALAKEKA